MIELRTLGGLEVRRSDGQDARPVVQPKRLALLTYLALTENGGYRRRDVVVAHLWPELDTAHARGALRQAAHFLRRFLGDVVLSRGEEEIGVNRDALWCDAVAFRERSAAGDHAAAMALYSGDFLNGFFVSDVAPEFEEWIETTRTDLRRRAAASAWACADVYRDAGNIAAGRDFARRAAALAPDDEAGVARLIAFLDAVGDRAGALETYDALAARLRTEYDAEPSPETQGIVQRVRARTIAGNSSRAPAPPSTAEPASTTTSVRRRRHVQTRAAIVGAIGIMAIVGRQLMSRDHAPTVAVIPLRELAADTSRSYVADGLTVQLITDLAQLGTLRVVNARTMMSFRGTTLSDREIAARLDVDAVMSGTLQFLGDTVRMTAQLVLADDDRTEWAQTFSGTRSDLLRMQREAARNVSRQLRVALERSASNERVHTTVPEALDAYIRGLYHWNQRGPGLLKSITLFNEALAIDATFAAAYAGIADAYVQLGYGNGLAPDDAFPKAAAAARRALELDSSLAEPHAALAFFHLYYDWNWVAAEREFKEAIRLNPRYATAHEWYGLYLAAMGRFRDAEAEEAEATKLDALSVPVAGTAAWVRYYAGDFTGAKRELKIALRVDSTFSLGRFYLGRVYQALGASDSALAEYRSTGPLRDGVPTIAAEGHLLASLNRTAAAESVLARLGTMARTQYVTAYGVALVHAALERPDSAFAWLERGYQERTNWMVWLNRDPRWAPIRADPRFAALTARMRLPK